MSIHLDSVSILTCFIFLLFFFFGGVGMDGGVLFKYVNFSTYFAGLVKHYNIFCYHKVEKMNSAGITIFFKQVVINGAWKQKMIVKPSHVYNTGKIMFSPTNTFSVIFYQCLASFFLQDAIISEKFHDLQQ